MKRDVLLVLFIMGHLGDLFSCVHVPLWLSLKKCFKNTHAYLFVVTSFFCMSGHVAGISVTFVCASFRWCRAFLVFSYYVVHSSDHVHVLDSF